MMSANANLARFGNQQTKPKTRRATLAILWAGCAAVVFVAGCGQGSTPSVATTDRDNTPATATPPTATAPTGTLVKAKPPAAPAASQPATTANTARLETLLRDHKWRDALALCNENLKQAPNDAAQYNNRGVTQQQFGDIDTAMADYSKAIQLDADYCNAYCNRASIYLVQRQHERAINDFTNALRVDPDNAFALTYRGLSYHQQENYDQAIVDFNAAIKLEPSSPAAHCNLGYVYADLGRYQEAITALSAAIKLDAGWAPAYDKRGYCHYMLGDREKADADHLAAKHVRPQNTAPRALERLGRRASRTASR